MGAGGVGKSAITGRLHLHKVKSLGALIEVRFINGSYLEWYDPTSTSPISELALLC